MESSKKKLRQIISDKGLDFTNITSKEFGLQAFIEQHCQDITATLQKYFPATWQIILALAYGRLVHQSPIKNMAWHFQKSSLSDLYKVNLQQSVVSSFLRQTGNNRKQLADYMKDFICGSKCILIDATNIYSYSQSLPCVKIGYTKDKTYNTQFSLLYLYAADLNHPAFFRIFDGNVKDVKMVSLVLQESGVKDVVIVGDKGFFSDENADEFEKEELRYITPLKRNDTRIDYTKVKAGANRGDNNFFIYQNRIIWYWSNPDPEVENIEDSEKKARRQSRVLITFLDERLRLKENEDFMRHMEKYPKKYNLDSYYDQKDCFGTLTMQVNMNTTEVSEQDVYCTYKSRNEVEIMFDGLKNIIDCDATYMQDGEVLEGWMFINHVALQCYYKLFQLLKKNDKLKRYSVSDIITYLKDTRKVFVANKWHPEPMTKKIKTLFAELCIHTT